MPYEINFDQSCKFFHSFLKYFFMKLFWNFNLNVVKVHRISSFYSMDLFRASFIAILSKIIVLRFAIDSFWIFLVYFLFWPMIIIFRVEFVRFTQFIFNLEWIKLLESGWLYRQRSKRWVKTCIHWVGNIFSICLSYRRHGRFDVKFLNIAKWILSGDVNILHNFIIVHLVHLPLFIQDICLYSRRGF